jgi:hypothetical protein
LFALLAALGAVNVYVFFFHPGTAPREILKPSSTMKAAEAGAAEVVKREAAAARLAVGENQATTILAPVAPPRAKAPVVVAPLHVRVRAPVPAPAKRLQARPDVRPEKSTERGAGHTARGVRR